MREIACCIREETKRRVRGRLIDKSRHDETRHISRHYDDTSLFWPERSAVAIRGLRKRNSMLVGGPGDRCLMQRVMAGRGEFLPVMLGRLGGAVVSQEVGTVPSLVDW